MSPSLTQFKAVYQSSMLVPDTATITALSLIFEKIYLPNNIEIIRDFCRHFRVEHHSRKTKGDLTIESEDGSDPFPDLSDRQRQSAYNYLNGVIDFCLFHHELFPTVFETQLFPDSNPFDVTLVKKGLPGELNTYNVGVKNLQLVGEDSETLPRLLSEGYWPVIGMQHQPRKLETDTPVAKQLSAMLAMKSIQMILPGTKPAKPAEILEARDRLRDHLPPFWSAMLKLTIELQKRVKNSNSPYEIVSEAQDLVDTTVRPAIIDLQQKLEQERKLWFYKILSPIQKCVRIMVGNPPVTQQQLITNALVLSSDIAMSTAENMYAIEKLKADAGLTFLLDAHNFFAQ